MDALAWIKKEGIVLMSGKGPVPSLAEKVAGQPIKGSWWGHPKAAAIFAAAGVVAESPDVLMCKLVGGKVTFVHRRLWPALVALAGEIGRERLARIDQEHTASGKHVNRVTPFPEWVPRDLPPMSTEDARRAISPALLPSQPRRRKS